MFNKPEIVILHNAGFGPGHYRLLADHLELHGYTVQVPSLPSTHGPNVSDVITWDADTAVITDTIRTVLDQRSKNVVVMAHGSSTMPASSALVDSTPAARRSNNTSVLRASVIALLAIGSPLLAPNQSLLDFTGGKPALIHQLSDDGRLFSSRNPPGPGYWFFNDVLPPQLVIDSVNALVPSSWRVNACPIGEQVVWDDPGNGMRFGYLVCQRDPGMPAAAQMQFARDVQRRRAGNKGENWTDPHYSMWTIDSGRSPFLSMTSAVGDWIRQEAGEEGVSGPMIIAPLLQSGTQ